MKTMFRSQELWEIVEQGYLEPEAVQAEPDQRLRENRKKDAKALFFIQSALDDSIFPRISAAATSKQAWEILKQEFFGDKKVITVKLQTLRSQFENLAMKDKESVQRFLSRVSEIVSQMKIYGDNITSETIVGKVLRSLHYDYRHIVTAILESKDLSTYTFDELMSSLIAHEERLSMSIVNAEEKAFQVKGELVNKDKQDFHGSKGQNRGGFRGRGRGKGRGQFVGQRQFKSNIQCYYCKKFGHKESECWGKQNNNQKGANFAEHVNDESKLFMAHSPNINESSGVWYVDSGCSNHMCGSRSLFKEIDELKRGEVRLGDNKPMQVAGIGTIEIETAKGKVKLLHKV